MFVTHLIELGNRCNRSLIMLDPKIGAFKTWSSVINNFINEFYEMSFGNHDEFLIGLDIETCPNAGLNIEKCPNLVSEEEIMLELDCIPFIEVEKVDEYISYLATINLSEDTKEEYFGLLWNISLGKIVRKINRLDIYDDKKTFLFIRELLTLLESGDENFDRFNVITTSSSGTYEKSVKLYNRFHKDSVYFISKCSSTSHNSIQVFDSLFSGIK